MGALRPLVWVLVQFPETPANMWGGLLGLLLGTHSCYATPYSGGRWYVDLFSFRSRNDTLRNQNGWRERVHNFVYDDDRRQQAGATQVRPQQQHMGTRPPDT